MVALHNYDPLIMYVIRVRNVNEALGIGLALLRDSGVERTSRAGPTLEMPMPVVTQYTSPKEMILYDAARDANPFFHFFEALWILAGRREVAFLKWLLPKMAEFSDDGNRFHAPYGYRLRHNFGFDQLEAGIEKFRKSPDTRQVAFSIWDVTKDWEATKDVPCNDFITFKLRDGALHMTVANRSNDVVWGAYGANVVQFSSLLCYMAGRLGVDVGHYYQVSDSYHVYTDLPFWKEWVKLHPAGVPPTPFTAYDYPKSSFFDTWELQGGQWDEDLTKFFQLWDKNVDLATFTPTADTARILSDPKNYLTEDFRGTVAPMFATIWAWKQKQYSEAVDLAQSVLALDWREAGRQWTMRRVQKMREAV